MKYKKNTKQVIFAAKHFAFRFQKVLLKVQKHGTCQLVGTGRVALPLRCLRLKILSDAATVTNSHVADHQAHGLFVFSLIIIIKYK